MTKQAVIFDLDGVIISTDEYHYQAWKQVSEEEGIPFDRVINERLRGVSRMESLSIILEKASKSYTELEKEQLAEKKNGIYRELLYSLTPDQILPGVKETLLLLKRQNTLLAIGSSSKNAVYILEKIGLTDFFDAIVSGNDIKKSKPDPDIFLLAAKKLGVPPEACVVVEDADAGVEAAIASGMKVVGVGAASKNPKVYMQLADLQSGDIQTLFYSTKGV